VHLDAAYAAVSMPGPLARLVGELPLGVVHLSPDGDLTAANAAASAMLEGSGGSALSAALGRLALRAAEVRLPVSEAVLPSPLGEVRVLLTATEGEGFLAVLDRDPTRRLRDQAVALRGMLAAAVECDRPEAALQRALEAMGRACRESELTLWSRSDGDLLTPLLRAGKPAPAGAAGALAEEEWLARRAVQTELPVHAPRPAPAAPGLQPLGEQGAALAIPVRDGEAVIGALLASGPRLGEGELRLLAGLADAAGSLLGRARARAALEAAQARAERAKAVAVEREGLATLGHVAACVTHEIASPLACLGSNLRAAQENVMELLALARDGGEPARAQEVAAELMEMLADSGTDVSRVATLVQSMRGLSHRRADDKLRFDPRGPVEDAVRIFRGARHFEVRLEGQPDLPYVHGSPALLCQLLLNLLDNGLYAMGGVGELSVWLGRGPAGAVVLEVEDRGQGIPPEVAERVFEPYFTTKPPGQGTGLGLYICKDVVERMGGHIGFRSGPVGTCFRVEMPPAP